MQEKLYDSYQSASDFDLEAISDLCGAWENEYHKASVGTDSQNSANNGSCTSSGTDVDIPQADFSLSDGSEVDTGLDESSAPGDESILSDENVLNSDNDFNIDDLEIPVRDSDSSD